MAEPMMPKPNKPTRSIVGVRVAVRFFVEGGTDFVVLIGCWIVARADQSRHNSNVSETRL